MTFSGVFHSVLSSAARRSDVARAPGDGEQAALRCCEVYRKSFPMAEIAFPASVLHTSLMAKWARDNRLCIDIHTAPELAVAFAAGIHPSRMTVHADGLNESDLRAVAKLAPGRVVVNSIKQIEMLTAAVERRTQGIFIHVIDENAPTVTLTDGLYSLRGGFRLDSNELDRVITAVVNNARLDLVGLYCSVGTLEQGFVSYPAAIGHIITQMADIRRQHGVVLTRLGLGSGGTVHSGNWTVELRELAIYIEDALDDACATMRYPRPIVVLSPGQVIPERSSA